MQNSPDEGHATTKATTIPSMPARSDLLRASSSAASYAAAEENADAYSGESELRHGGDAARPVPAAPAVEDLLTARAKPREDVLEVGEAGGGSPERGRIERPAGGSERGDQDEAASDLEAAARDVLVRYGVRSEMQRRPERKRSRPRADERAGEPTCRDMGADDHELGPRRILDEHTRRP